MQTGHEWFEFFEKQKKKFEKHYSSDCLQNIFRGIHNIIIIKISGITNILAIRSGEPVSK